MSATPYYIALILVFCVGLLWVSLLLDLFGMRYWMHYVTQILEENIKKPIVK